MTDRQELIEGLAEFGVDVDRSGDTWTDNASGYLGPMFESQLADLLALLRSIRGPQGGEGWRPIETAPKDEVILIWSAYGQSVAMRHWAPEFTHWMPLPPPPDGGGGGDQEASGSETAVQGTAALDPDGPSLQARVRPWMFDCFGPVIPFDRVERGDRLLEEVFELLQSGGYDPDRVAPLRDYAWGRPVGEPAQEVGGVMVTLAAYCNAFDLDMHEAGETELARIAQPEVVEKIRAKQAAKPTGSALPIALSDGAESVHLGPSDITLSPEAKQAREAQVRVAPVDINDMLVGAPHMDRSDFRARLASVEPPVVVTRYGKPEWLVVPADGGAAVHLGASDASTGTPSDPVPAGLPDRGAVAALAIDHLSNGNLTLATCDGPQRQNLYSLADQFLALFSGRVGELEQALRTLIDAYDHSLKDSGAIARAIPEARALLLSDRGRG